MLWQKEKLLVISSFSFSHSVYKDLVLQTCKSQGLFWKGLKATQLFNVSVVSSLCISPLKILDFLTLSQTSPAFHVSFENTVGKGEIAHNEQFLLFPQ